MNRRRNLVLGLAVACAGAVACAASDASPGATSASWSTAPRGAGLGAAKSAITGGTDTTLYPFVVGINISGNATCSGTLIAPNLVLTARHCVASLNTGEQIDCATSKFGANNSPTAFHVTTRPLMYSGNPPYRNVVKVTTPTPSAACGNDIALLQLAQNVPASEAPTAEPLIGHTLYNTTLYSIYFTAIGYGLTGSAAAASGTEGTRRIRQNMFIQCLQGRRGSQCDIPAGTISDNDVVTSAGTCQGDSGSGMFEQNLFDKGTYLTSGVLSRGDATCDNSIYTRTDAWTDFLVANAKAAAAAGGYPAPAWTTPPAPTADDAAYVKPSRDAGVDTGPVVKPTPQPLGAVCTQDGDCASATCLAPNAASSFVCTQACTAAATCPSGYACTSGYCFAGTAPDPAATAPSTAATTGDSSGGCTVGPFQKDPTKPIPWRLGGLAALALVALRRRRR